MACTFISTSLAISLFITTVTCRSTYNLAPRVEQSLVDRATYLGGWPLAAVPCPADASVICSTGIESQINQQCCPSGNTCFSWPSITPVCCPTCKCPLGNFPRSANVLVSMLKFWYVLAQNCIGQLQNLPVCANSSWNMFDLGENSYFCCEQGQVGVIPQTGYAGICQAGSQGVPSSLLATMVGRVHLQAFTMQITNVSCFPKVNQIGGTSVTSFNSVSTGTGSSTPVTNLPTAVTATISSAGSSAGSSSSTGGSSPSPSSSSSSNVINSSSSSVQLGSGAIAGIAVGSGIVVAALIFVLWKCCSRKPPVQPYASPSEQIHKTYDPATESSFQPGSPPLHEYKVSPANVPVSRIHEVPGGNGPFERAEMDN
jgi:hypothetical protein